MTVRLFGVPLFASVVRLVPGSLLPTMSRIEVFFLSYWLLLRRRRLCAISPPLRSADPIGDAVAEGTAAGLGGRASSHDVHLRAQKARDEAFASGDWGNAIGTLLSLVRNHPSDEVLQRITARVLDEMGDLTRAVSAWEGIVARFPLSREGFISLVATVARRSGTTAPRALIKARCSVTFNDFLTIARAWDMIGDANEARIAFGSLITLFKDRDEAWSAAISRLEALGFYRQAATVLRCAAATSPQPRQYCDRLAEIESIADCVPAEMLRPRQHRSLSALSGLLSELVAARNEVASAAVYPGSVVMVTDGLGAGGAEQQLLYTALGLRAPTGFRQWPGCDRITVVAESCRVRKSDGFFRPQLEAAGIPVFEYEGLPLFGGRFASSAMRSITETLRFLPTVMVESVVRLSDALRQWRPDVVLIWQEKTVFEAGLAALLARVPRIILCLRSVPVIDRPERYRPEYPLIFKALLAASGVDFSCNSRYAASRYSQWLGIDPARITIIPNGAAQPPTSGDEASDALFREFEARTSPSRLTVGVVMRMDENKRPLLWVETAASLLQRLPSARFILVGDGRLRRQATSWVEQRGIAERFLFVGLSRSVGFWLAKMDLLMLLSKHEGLPNALIEAQLSGVPVVTTPAGGAPEAMVPGVTGSVTAPNPSADETAMQVMSLLDEPDRLRQMGEAAAKWAADTFSMARMLRGTFALLSYDGQAVKEFGATAAAGS